MTPPDNPQALTLLDRDLSWLEFNRRVLHEAEDERTPLLERVKFLAIFSSNLDEFFMKRIGALSQRPDGLEAQAGLDPGTLRKLEAVRNKVLELMRAQADAYTRVIRPALARAGVHLLDWSYLSEDERRWTREFFRSTVYPVLTPLAVDPAHPFPFLSNLSTSLGILLRPPGERDPLFARVKVPPHLPQWVRLPETRPADGTPPVFRFARLLDIVRDNLGALFSRMELLEIMPFRLTRNAEVDLDEEDEGTLVEQVEQELRQRRLERAVRLEYLPPRSAEQLDLLTDKLDLDDVFVYESPAELDFTGLFAVAGLPRPDLRDPPWEPVVPAAFTDPERSVFSLIRSGDVLVHHPYESFDATVARFIRSAADDPRVLAIKMTVYRVGSETAFIDSLIRAAESGKQVACLVEVTARFDEQQNLHWARVLEKVGVHVVYGVLGLKTHTKTTLVVRGESEGLRCYAHIGTGNYNIKTARVYTDLSLLTCEPTLTRDVVELFHALTGGSRNREYVKLLVAPVNMRERFLALIEREIEHARSGRPAHIIAKLNQVEDRGMCEALVRAAQAGVPIDLVVRGFCVLPPGVPGLTENIRITSVIGRYLEHSRIYHFRNGATDPVEGEFFIGSADWMERNLSRRVEAVTPVEPLPLRQRLWQVLDVNLRDHRQAWDLHPDGSYVQRRPPPDAPPDSPERLGTHAALMALTLQSPPATGPGMQADGPGG
jgi:polyphosphate kinase